MNFVRRQVSILYLTPKVGNFGGTPCGVAPRGCVGSPLALLRVASFGTLSSFTEALHASLSKRFTEPLLHMTMTAPSSNSSI